MPRAPKYCGNLHCRIVVAPGVKYCDEHKPVAWSGGMNAHQGHGTTRAQRKLVFQVLREEPICADCGQAPSTEAGHILAKALGGKFVRDNLKGQCRPCNESQMHADRGASVDTPPYARAQGGSAQGGPMQRQPSVRMQEGPAQRQPSVHSRPSHAHVRPVPDTDVVIGTTWIGR